MSSLEIDVKMALYIKCSRDLLGGTLVKVSSHRRRSMVRDSSWGHKELDTTERLPLILNLSRYSVNISTIWLPPNLHGLMGFSGKELKFTQGT